MAVSLFALADSALANWWIVRSSDETCLVVDIEPKGNDKSVKVRTFIKTQEQAEADVERLSVKSQRPEISLRATQESQAEIT